MAERDEWSSREEWQIERMQKALEQFDEWTNQREAGQDEAWTQYLKRLDRRQRNGNRAKKTR
jgi:hypothetical protein